MFGLSTLAAAGLGNLCSDVCGLGLADYIESASEKFGLPQPNLSQAQRNLQVVRFTMAAGGVIGISIGCVVGMVPLLWIDHELKEGIVHFH